MLATARTPFKAKTPSKANTPATAGTKKQQERQKHGDATIS
jgi:hypothetical protein